MKRKLAILAALVVLAFGLSLIAGKTWIPPQIWFSGDPRVAIIVELRLPRALLGLARGRGADLEELGHGRGTTDRSRGHRERAE